MNSDTLLQCATGFFAVASLTHSMPALYRMTRETHNGVRVAYLLTASGAFGMLIGVFTGYIPSIYEALFISGVGSLALVGRREYFRCVQMCKKILPKPHYGRRMQDKKEA